MQKQIEQAMAELPDPLRQPVKQHWQAFTEAVPDLSDFPQMVAESLPRVWAASNFVAQQCVRQPALLPDLARGDLLQEYDWETYRERLTERLQSVSQESDLMRELRQFRQREMVRIIWRDIAGWAELMDTTRDLSHLAEACIDAALTKLYAWECEQSGTPQDSEGNPVNLVVVGMGKLGAWELNLSSDIDLIFAFAEEGEIKTGRSLSHTEFFARLGRRLINVLDQQTADGFVFRVDMRLRPFGDSGALAISFAAMESYYQIHGREWERYAMIKARVVGGDRQAGEQLMAMLKPFVYRRYLDFGAYEALREMKTLISREVKRKGLEHNVKLGAGGIREIEFIGQLFQLIRGGRDNKLTARKILKVLKHLGEADYLPAFVVEELITAYGFLRTVEHRLQEYEDRQTHVLPQDETGQYRLAYSMGYDGWESFLTDLDMHRQQVQGHFEQVFEAPQTEQGDEGAADLTGVWLGTLDEATCIRVLAESGYQAAEPLWKKLSEIRQSRAYHALSSQGRERLDRLMPLLLGAAGQADQPDQTIQRLLDLVSQIERRSVYLALLVENPLALSQLVRLSSASPWISHFLKQYPLLLDELLDPRSLYAPPDHPELVAELSRRMLGVSMEDQEQAMDILRQFKHANVLRVAAADIVEALPLMKVSDHLSWIAETVLDEALEQAWHHLTARHGRPPVEGEGKGFAIIGYGKLGGLELGYSSDLDLVFLHGAESEYEMTDGAAPLALQVFFARLGQRLIHVLTTYTPAGLLYEVDMRLRPDGASGMLVSSLKAYEAYQRDKAWLWEHQALVRARPVAGDRAIGERFQAIRRAILAQPRDKTELRQGILDMRRRMREELDRSKADEFNLKQGAGGIVDIEFMVQFGVLAHAHSHPELLDYTDNVCLLAALAKAGLMPVKDAEQLSDAYRHYRCEAHRRALQEQGSTFEASHFLEQREQVAAIWQRWLESE
ncbi:MAG: bifunctional [glutamate--ammonia ligase]-adenylyl-L-tyrosine phosphorylase/[glutamate--ammonia-ligase] adenylyltransferase [Gammaproteobacteria bacterium]|nr:bifunctional [glutamate--ammonia ligase]-adenylyl-L-tyrosine phosphorylase/[glutamate--ammonia-ligase] adenylyltransferase [Gammaproteobacteria bacterium]